MLEKIHIFRQIKKNGVEIKINNKKYLISYPSEIWEKFPKSLHRLFADCLAYIATWHLSLTEKKKIVYHFSHPLIEPTFFKMILYSLPMTVFEHNNLKTSEIIKDFYNYSFLTQFKALNYPVPGKKLKKRLKEKALILFSFGKESLLTYGLLREIGVETILFFIKEPLNTFENRHKKKLAEKFYKIFKQKIEFYPLSVGKLRQKSGMFWGWDIILSQYAFILIPYYFYFQTRYLFLGNEQSCNLYTTDKEGYFINPVFEQSIKAMQLIGDIPKLFFIQTHIGSLVEPINEIFALFILHHRYPEIGSFQMSCFSEQPQAKKKRWCGVCEKCARIYIFLKALNINPEKVGFYDNDMLSAKKEKLYVIFNGEKEEGISAYGGSGLGKDEQLLAFYLAYKRGVKGELIEKFKSKFLTDVEKRKKELFEKYFGIHSSYCLPSSLRKKILRIFDKEREKAKEMFVKFS